MRVLSSFACGIVAAAMMASAGGGDAQESRLLSVPNLSVTPAAVPVEPPYMRDPWKSYARNPYFGRYRVEEDRFPQVPCTQTRIAFGPGGKCLLGYRLSVPSFSRWRGSAPCDMALDVVIATTGKLSIEADILVFDPYKVVASGGSPPRYRYVRSYLGYDQEDFQDMNQVTRRGINWRNLQINDMQNQWYKGDRLSLSNSPMDHTIASPYESRHRCGEAATSG